MDEDREKRRSEEERKRRSFSEKTRRGSEQVLLVVAEEEEGREENGKATTTTRTGETLMHPIPSITTFTTIPNTAPIRVIYHLSSAAPLASPLSTPKPPQPATVQPMSGPLKYQEQAGPAWQCFIPKAWKKKRRWPALMPRMVILITVRDKPGRPNNHNQRADP